MPAFRLSPTLTKLGLVAPPGAVEGMLRWAEAQAHTKGRRTRDFTAVTDDGAWTQLLEHQPPVVYGRPKRRAVR